MSINISYNVLPAKRHRARSSVSLCRVGSRAGYEGRTDRSLRRSCDVRGRLAAEELLYLIGGHLCGDQKVFQVVSLELAQNKVSYWHLSGRAADAKLQAHKVFGLELISNGA